MMRDEPGKYWGSQENHERYRAAIERSIRTAPGSRPLLASFSRLRGL
jgi:hypothetical protein